MPPRTSPPKTVGSVLLAAGLGERLRPLTGEVAKAVLPVLDVPLGTWGLEGLDQHHPPVVVNASHLAASVAHRLRPGRPRSFEVFWEEPEPLGTGGTLRALRARVAERVVTWNADMVADLHVPTLLRAHAASGALATVAIVGVGAEADFETRAGRATRLVDRRRENVRGAQFIGIAVYERAALDLLDERVPLGATEGLLQPLLERSELAVFEHTGYALDVGTLERYLRVSRDVLEGVAPAPPAPLVGQIVEVDGGRAYVGLRAEVETSSLGPGAVVLAGSIIEGGARVARAIVWPDERVPAGTDLSDCVWFQGRRLNAAAASE